MSPHPNLRRASVAFAAMLVAWLFGAGTRAAWIADNRDVPGATFDGQPLLTTNDAYYYASGVQHEVAGTLQANPRVPGAGDSILVAVASGIVSLFGVSVADVCLWLPVVVAPLVAVPLVLLGLLLSELAWGFLAALVAVLGYSYWSRTMPGYFDTDMVAIPYVIALATLIVAAFWRRRALFGSLAASLAVFAPYMHAGSGRVVAALGLGVLAYSVVFARREAYGYRVALALFVAILPLPIWARLLLIAALEVGLTRFAAPLAQLTSTRSRRVVAWTLAVLAGAALVLLVQQRPPNVDLLLDNLGIRHVDDNPLVPGADLQDLADTVLEQVNPTVGRLAERVAGHPLLFATGILGYLAACWRFRPLLLLAPLLLLGTVIASSSQRYTIFAVPVVALGNAWLVVLCARFGARRVSQVSLSRLTAVVVASSLMACLVVPAVNEALAQRSPIPVDADEAAVLSDLRRRVAPGDFLITWWDYAYGAWYFAGVNTLIDGTKQNGDSWIVAELLFTRSQREAATLARLAAEYQAVLPPLWPVLDDMTVGWQRDNGRPLSDFVPALREGRVPLPTTTRQVFVYLPWRMLFIASNIARLRLAKGLVPTAELEDRGFIAITPLAPDASVPVPDWTWDAARQLVTSRDGRHERVYKVLEVGPDARGGIGRRETLIDAEGQACVVNLRHSNMQLLMDRARYESVLSQLLLVVAPDPAFFELVKYAPGGVTYRVLP